MLLKRPAERLVHF